MKFRVNRRVGLLAITCACALAVSFSWVQAQQGGGATVAIDGDDIGGVVASAKGPEAGVWVIAETTDLPAKFAKMVVTDDQGRYVLPDLPQATYQVFVRGYGLVDSPRVPAKPGQHLDLKAVVAPDGRAAAKVYPANYWLSLLRVPKGDLSEKDVMIETKACYSCHQVGDVATRELTKNLGSDKSSLEKWDHHVTMGPSGGQMAANFKRLGAQRQMYADWTERIAEGAYPKEAPPRPKGVERNLVISMWDWALPTSRRTDVAATDERTPTMNANGLLYGTIQGSDILAVLDPKKNETSMIKIPSNAPVIDDKTPESPYWGTEKIWQRQADPRSVAMDAHGRVWLTARIRAPQQQPASCTDGSNKFSKYFPLKGPGTRQVEMYDPKTKQFTMIDTCFAADHNKFDDKDSLVFGQNSAIGWLDTATFDKTHDAAASQGWCPAVLDTNGDGKITEGWTEPNEPIDPKKDHRINFGCYSDAIDPTDGSIWCSGIGERDTTLVRLERGLNPPQTCKAEVYVPPPDMMRIAGSGGVAIGSDGSVWQNWRGAHEILKFDRNKCKGPLNGPNATGQHCAEGWTVYKRPGPTFEGGSENQSTDMFYLTEVDRENTLGLGENVVLAGDVNADSFFVVMPKTGEMLTLRVPYPQGFHSRHASGRIDDPNAGWKGRGFWSSYSMYTPWHQEGGKGSRSKIVKFQSRPNPLAK
jgi:hypothetical protein